MTKHINSMIVKYDNMKTDAELEKIVKEMEGKSEEEMTKIMLREGLLVPVQKVRSEFHVTQTRKTFLEKLKGVFK